MLRTSKKSYCLSIYQNKFAKQFYKKRKIILTNNEKRSIIITQTHFAQRERRSTMLRERIKQMDLKVTELSDYLQVSRPTMYKFIEYYDEQNFDLINRKVLKLFNYISENEFIGKKTVISYILNNLVELKPMGEKNDVAVINKLRKNIVENPESKKSKFLEMCVTTTFFDELINYLPDIAEISKKRKRLDDEQRLLDSYRDFVEKIKTNYN